MSSLFSGLEKFGLGKLEKMDVFEEEEKKEPEQEVKQEKPKVAEESLLLEKTYTCPVCDTEFHSKAVRSGRTRLLSQDTDLRPKYQPIDTLKYDAIACPNCGYAALSRFFKYMMPAQAQMIRDNISKNFSGLKPTGDTYTYDDALLRHQLALANTVVKKAKASEKAYTCLKMAWLCRGKAETLPKDTPDYDKQVAALNKEETELLGNAYAGFNEAFSKEDFPMCGMDEMTVTCIVADLARRIGKFDEASRWISRILTSREASSRLKDRARDIKDLINAQKGQ